MFMRYVVGFLVTLGLIIVLIVLLLTGGGSKKTPQIAKPQNTSELAAYADTAVTARVTIDGQINADQNHTALRITVNRDDVTYEQIQGYQGTVINRQSFANNQSAYNNFLYAIGHAGFLLGSNDSRLANEKGYCPLGHRYIIELMDGSRDIERYWATNCGGSAPKTYKGNLGLTLNLFELQVPNFDSLSQNLQNF